MQEIRSNTIEKSIQIIKISLLEWYQNFDCIGAHISIWKEKSWHWMIHIFTRLWINTMRFQSLQCWLETSNVMLFIYFNRFPTKIHIFRKAQNSQISQSRYRKKKSYKLKTLYIFFAILFRKKNKKQKTG